MNLKLSVLSRNCSVIPTEQYRTGAYRKNIIIWKGESYQFNLFCVSVFLYTGTMPIHLLIRNGVNFLEKTPPASKMSTKPEFLSLRIRISITWNINELKDLAGYTFFFQAFVHSSLYLHDFSHSSRNQFGVRYSVIS